MHEPLASAGVTRMKGAGYTAKDALALMEARKLEFIRDFNGSTGEHQHGHDLDFTFQTIR